MSAEPDYVEIIKNFPWHDYGLDVVGETESDDWAIALACAFKSAWVDSLTGRAFMVGYQRGRDDVAYDIRHTRGHHRTRARYARIAEHGEDAE